MPTQNIHVVTEPGTLEEAFEQLAKLQKTLRYLLNGNLDFENLRARSIKAENIEVGTLTAQEIAANTITADKMNVNELSAITANLGHILAGLIESVEIYGSLISTNQFGYPRAVMSNTENLFGAYLSLGNGAEIRPAGWSGVPALALSRTGALYDALISFPINLTFTSPTGVTVNADTGSINLRTPGASGFVNVDNWSSFRNDSTGETLQQALNSIQSSVNSLWTYASGLDARITALGG